MFYQSPRDRGLCHCAQRFERLREPAADRSPAPRPSGHSAARTVGCGAVLRAGRIPVRTRCIGDGLECCGRRRKSRRACRRSLYSGAQGQPAGGNAGRRTAPRPPRLRACAGAERRACRSRRRQCGDRAAKPWLVGFSPILALCRGHRLRPAKESDPAAFWGARASCHVPRAVRVPVGGRGSLGHDRARPRAPAGERARNKVRSCGRCIGK